MDNSDVEEFWGLIVFGFGLLLMGIGKLFKRWFS